jgi:hypothetical protein
MKVTTDHSILAWNPLWGPWGLGNIRGEKRGAFATTVDEFREAGRVRSFSVLNESSFEMTNLGLRITLPCYPKKSQGNRRLLFACLNCKFEDNDALLGIWLNEAASEGQPLGRFFRTNLDTMSKDRGLWKRKAKPTSLYIIQSLQFFRPAPQPGDNDFLARVPAPPPFSLEYNSLIRAGYELEAYITRRRSSQIQIDECKITFFQDRYLGHGPQIVFSGILGVESESGWRFAGQPSKKNFG